MNIVSLISLYMGFWTLKDRFYPSGWYWYPDNQRDTTGGELALATGLDESDGHLDGGKEGE